MKILYTCTYSDGVSGVWNRVYQLAKQMIKRGHKVYVISSDRIAGKENERLPRYDFKEGIHFYRFPAISFGSPNAFIYRPSQLKTKLREIMPDIVDCQTYRHHEGYIIMNECKKLGIKCVLTTHSPFNRKRGFVSSTIAKLYDRLLGSKNLRQYNAVISILPSEDKYISSIISTGREVAS